MRSAAAAVACCLIAVALLAVRTGAGLAQQPTPAAPAVIDGPSSDIVVADGDLGCA